MGSDKKDIFKTVITVFFAITIIVFIGLFIMYIYAQFDEKIDEIVVNVISKVVALYSGIILLWCILSIAINTYKKIKG